MKKIFTILIALGMAASCWAQTLTVSPEKLSSIGTVLSGATASSIQVYNSAGSGTCQYTVSVPATATNWLSTSVAGGSSTGEVDTITLTFDTSGLAVGFYTTTITVKQTNATVQTKSIPVTLNVQEDYGLGLSIGPASMADTASSIAIGDRSGRAVAVGANTIQIGGGVNSSAGTTKVRAWELLTSAGIINSARLSGIPLNASSLTGNIAVERLTNALSGSVDSAVTAVSVASEVDCLGAVEPSTTTVLRSIGDPTTIEALVDATLELQTATFTVSETEYTVVTNVTISLSTSSAVSGYASQTTVDAITSITSNVVQAAKTVSVTTDDFVKP